MITPICPNGKTPFFLEVNTILGGGKLLVCYKN